MSTSLNATITSHLEVIVMAQYVDFALTDGLAPWPPGGYTTNQLRATDRYGVYESVVVPETYIVVMELRVKAVSPEEASDRAMVWRDNVLLAPDTADFNWHLDHPLGC